MRKSGLLLKFTAVAMVVCLLVSGQPWTFSAAAFKQDAENAKLYLSEVKMFYGETEDTARGYCEKEGYIFCPANLNEGASGSYKGLTPMGIYMGYKTTDDPEDALTDLTLLDMKYTHFEEMSYKEFLDAHISDFKNEAGQLMVLVADFRQKVEAESPNALMALDSLNLFYVDEAKSHDAAENLFGNYLLKEADITFFEKFIQRGSAMVLSRITELLCSAVSDYNEDGTTWVDRVKTSELTKAYLDANSAQQNEYDERFQDPAQAFIKEIRAFSENYAEAKRRFDKYGETFGYPELEGMTDENALEKLNAAGVDCRFPEYSEALKTYRLMEAVPYQKKGEQIVSNAALLEEGGETSETTETYTSDMTLAEFIMELAKDETLEDHPSTVYPIVAALSRALTAALTLGGFTRLVEGLFQAEDYAAKREKAVKEAMQKLKALGCEDGRAYLWMDSNTEMYDKKIVQTNAAREAELSGTDLRDSQNAKAREEGSDKVQILTAIDIATLGYGGVIMIITAFAGTSLWTIGTNCLAVVGMNLAAGALGSAAGLAVFGALFCAMQVLSCIAIVVGLAMLVYTILEAIGAFESKEEISYEGIPDIVSDVRTNADGKYRVRYDAVTSNATKDVFSQATSYYFNQLKNTGGGVLGVFSTLLNTENLSTDHAELNAYQSNYDRWITMYYSKSPACGDPIEVRPGEEPFVTRNDYQAPEGYRPLSLIINSTAVNVNDVEVYSEKGSPLYVFIPGAGEPISAGVEGDGKTFISSVHLSWAEKKEDAVNYLKDNHYEYFDVNLTPYDGYTILGYQLTTDEKSAIRDIRVCNTVSNPNFGYTFGDASYAKAGEENGGSTPDGMSLYISSSPSAGSPITGLEIFDHRLELGSGMEPVCLFSGGNAVDFSHNWKDNILQIDDEDWEDDVKGYFTATIGGYNYVSRSKDYARYYLDEEDTEKGLYIYFTPKIQYKATNENGDPQPQYIGGFSYFMAGDNETEFDKYGSNYEYMQTFAANNGFELLEENGEPLRVMSDSAGEMTLGTVWYDRGGGKLNTYTYEQFHTVADGQIMATNDGGYSMYLESSRVMYELWDNVSRDENDHMIYHTAMYFGVSYTYNPYRAITGVAGLVTPYTETTSQLKYTGLTTPAGAFLPCSVSIQGCPIMHAGISASYYNVNTMHFPLYTNYEAKQKTDLPWMAKNGDSDSYETEILTRYLLTAGPRDGVSPLRREDITFGTQEKPVTPGGFVPLCDLRTPGDYDHPMNLALETTNKGSKYLYLYLKADAGGRDIDREEVRNDKGKVTQKAKILPINNEYAAKEYVTAIFCGVGKTPEAAISNLYVNMSKQWASIAEACDDLSKHPMITEMAEILPVDLSNSHPWYDLHLNSTDVSSLDDGKWVRGNEAAYYRWDGHNPTESSQSADDYENTGNCAYIGVVRTGVKKNAAYGLLKLYSDDESSSSTLNVGATKCYLAGGPVQSPEGSYYLYYTPNTGAGGYKAPITKLAVNDEIFINGYNSTYTVSDNDRDGLDLPSFSQMRKRPDEYKYIHLGYNRADLPYYEGIYIGVGKSKKDAFIDMISTSGAFGATDVDCNYNSFSGKWIAIGYRRTATAKDGITDIFLYQGDDPPEKVYIDGGYTAKKSGKELMFSDYTVNGAGVEYKLLKHNLKVGSDIVSLNEGNGGKGLYLYYTTKSFYYAPEAEAQIAPITNLSFTYGDISPRMATAEDLAAVYENTYYAYGKKDFSSAYYQNPIWECVLGVSGSPMNYSPSGEGAKRFSLNEGVLPGIGNSGWHTGDHRVYMYVDRQISSGKGAFKIRENAKLPEFGYYSAKSIFGVLRQVG